MKVNALTGLKGSLEVICGPMFAGKTEELLRRINRFKYADIKYLIFKPKIDTRSGNSAKSRDGRAIDAIEVEDSTAILEYVLNLSKKNNVDAIAIDEAQFFDEQLGRVANELANMGYLVYVAGLDLDFKAKPFPSMSNCLSYADHITKLKGVCVVCGAPSTRTQRLINGRPASANSPTVMVGDSEAYESRCRRCHKVK